MKARRRFFPVVLVVVIAFIALAAAVIMLNKYDEAPIRSDAVPSVFSLQQIRTRPLHGIGRQLRRLPYDARRCWAVRAWHQDSVRAHYAVITPVN